MVAPAVVEHEPPALMAGRTSSRYSLVLFGMSGYFIRLPSPALCAMTKASRSDSRANCASGWLALSCLTPSSRFLRYMPPYWAWMFGSVMPWGGVWSAPSGCTPRHTLRLSCNRPQVPPLLSSAYASGLNPDSRRMRAAMKSAPNPLDWAARSTQGLACSGTSATLDWQVDCPPTATVGISHINRLIMSMTIAPTTSNGRPAAADTVAMTAALAAIMERAIVRTTHCVARIEEPAPERTVRRARPSLARTGPVRFRSAL